MANKEHIVILERGVESWNQWRNDSRDIPDLTQADLSNKNFSGVNFTKADLREANLNYSDFSEADLSGANLSMIRFEEICARYDALLEHLNDEDWWNHQESYYGSSAMQMSIEANRQLKELAKDKLRSGGTPLRTTLIETNLRAVKFLGANLKGALLTGACIENWNIDVKTNLNNVVCQYIYLKEGQQERRPLTGELQSGEFATLCQTYWITNSQTH